jgi:hypothetical protein
MGTHRSALQLASALGLGLLGWGCATDPRAVRPTPAREVEVDERVEEGDDEPAVNEVREPDASVAAPAREDASRAPAHSSTPEPDEPPPAPKVELPLALCEKYFPQSSPLPILSMATMAFWAEDNCSVAGLFGDIDQTIDFLNYLRDWSLLILGCEAPHDVHGGAETFGPAYPLDGAPLAQADLDALVDHFMHTLSAALPLESEDDEQLRDALVQLSREVPLCDCPPQLDLCAGDAEPEQAARPE